MLFRARHLAAALALILFGWAISEAVDLDNSEGSWLLRFLFHPGPRYFELTADLMIDGEPVTVTRTIECAPYFYNPFDSPLQPYWHPAREAMTERLASGKGVIVVVPKGYCSQYQEPQPTDAPPWGAFPQLPGDYIPVIGLVDNADNPTELRLYVSGTKLRSPSSDVQLLGVRIRNSSDLEPEASPREFGLWENLTQAGYLKNKYNRETFYAFYARVISRDEWESIPVLRQGLTAIHTPQFLEGELASVARAAFPATLGILSVIEGSFDEAQLTAEPEADRFIEVAPFRRIGGVLTFSSEAQGILIYHQLSQLAEGLGWPELPLRIGGVEVTNRHLLESQFFLPDEQVLLNISWNTLRFVTPRMEPEAEQ